MKPTHIEKALPKLVEALNELGLDPHEFGTYLQEKVAEDRHINEVTSCVTEQVRFYERKHILSVIEVISVILIK